MSEKKIHFHVDIINCVQLRTTLDYGQIHSCVCGSLMESVSMRFTCLWFVNFYSFRFVDWTVLRNEIARNRHLSHSLLVFFFHLDFSTLSVVLCKWNWFSDIVICSPNVECFHCKKKEKKNENVTLSLKQTNTRIWDGVGGIGNHT